MIMDTDKDLADYYRHIDKEWTLCGRDVCDASYRVHESGEFVAYQKLVLREDTSERNEHRNADTISDGVGTMWDCPFCGNTEARGDTSGLVL